MKSEAGKALLRGLREEINACLKAIDALDFNLSKAAIEAARAKIKAHQGIHVGSDEDTLNDLAILAYLAGFLSDYCTFWQRVVNKEYEPSWMALQDALDSIRLLKRVSSVDVTRFETQLGDLEKTYPYKIFASIGCIAERIECSICSKDIDSFECTHRGGQLYAGRMAYGIVQNLKAFDHVALTENPEDKRCVMQVQGQRYDFPAIDWLANNLNAKSFVVSDFSHVEMSQRRERTDGVARVGRNAPCFCGSGKKFKHCCIDEKYTTHPHAEFIIRGNPKVIA